MLRFLVLVLVLVLFFAGKTSSHSDSSPHVVMWQDVSVETVVASHLQINLTMKSSKGLRRKSRKSSKGVQEFHTTLHKDTDSPKETLLSEGSSFPLKLRENKIIALENGNKATFDCQVEPPLKGYSKPWIEVDTGNMYCLFFPYSKDKEPLKEEASFALLLGRLSLSRTRKMMNITTELNNVIISILENSDIQFHWHKENYLSMSLWEDIDVAQSEVKKLSVKDQIIIMLGATDQGLRMIIRYEIDKPKKKLDKYLVMYIILLVLICVIMLVFFVIAMPRDELREVGAEAKMKTLKESKEKST